MLNAINATLEYIETKAIKENTKRNFRALVKKLQTFEVNTGKVFDFEKYDLMAVKGVERREKIKEFKALWGEFMEFSKTVGANTTQTRNGYVNQMKTIIGWVSKDYGYIIPKPEPEKQVSYSERKVGLPTNVVNRIINLPMSMHWAVPVLKLALYSCWRVSDLVELNQQDVKLGEWMGQQCYFLIKLSKKTGKPMQTPVPTGIVKYLLRKNAMPDEKLIQHPEGRALDERLLVQAVREVFYKDHYLRVQMILQYNTEGKAVEIPFPQINRPMHAMRAAGASLLIEKGLTPDTVAKWFTGHRTLNTLRDHYVTSDDITNASDLLKNRFVLEQSDKFLQSLEEE